MPLPRGLRYAPAIGAAWLLVLVLPAAAQDLPRAVPGVDEPFPNLRGMSVTDRPHPGYDPLGIRFGGFVLYPALDVAGSYEDNIFATDTGTVSDFIVDINPTIKLASTWSNHALNFFAGADIIRYLDNPSEDTIDWVVGTDGIVNFSRNSQLDLLAQYEQLTQERGSPDDVSGSEPTEFQVITGKAGYAHQFNRFSLAPHIQVQRFTFDNVPSTMGPIDNSDRDRVETTLGTRASYDVMPNVAAFVQTETNFRVYDDSVDDNGFDRDSHGINVSAGASLDFTGLLFGDFYVGYLAQYYDDPSLSTITGVSAGADLTWNVTQMTTVNTTVQTIVNETTLAGASGYLSTVIGASVDHELLRNVILHAGIAGRWDNYQGITREDEYIDGDVSAQYLINRYLRFELLYDFTQRDSNVAGDDYTQNSIQGRLRVQY